MIFFLLTDLKSTILSEGVTAQKGKRKLAEMK